MFGEDEEILQDFLVEAGEILEQLSEQLVDLEQRPDDRDLLNAIFRGFHTVKGGAGFLQLNALVECCHVTENLFDILRNGQRVVTPELMDVVLQALDAVNEMFEQVKSGDDPRPADPALLGALSALVDGEDDGSAQATSTEAGPVVQESAIEAASVAPPQEESDITDAEFEQFLNAIADPEEEQAKATPISESAQASSPATNSTANNDISDDEFESLLDEIHGKGKHGGAAATSSAAQTPTVSSTASSTAPSTAPVASQASSGSDEITEDEFEALLNELHGAGKPSGSQPGVGVGKLQTTGAAPSTGATQADQQSSPEKISDTEFEDLLDQLHGAGQGPTNGIAAETKSAETKSTDTKSADVATNKDSTDKKAASAGPLKAVPSGKTKSSDSDSKKAAKSTAPKKAGSVAKETVAAEATVRVDTQRLDDIMNMVGELVLVRNRLVRLGVNSGDEVMAKAVSNLDVVTADLQTAVMKTRMQPIKKVFGRFPRVVRDLARNLKKEVKLELQGEETDLDKNLVEALADPLVHLVRNSVDHGIEMPDVREKSGKSRVGQVILAAEQEGDHILLSITDDGAGMDPDVLRKKAIEKGLYDEDAAARLSDSECFNIIFMPGFSTKTEISDVSGRGVGMDVVKTKITQLNGSVEIQSKIGEGTRLEIKVPLTLAIMPTLMVMLGDQTFAFPLVSVNEIFHMDLTRTNVVDGQEVVTVRDKALPLFYLKNWLVGRVPSSESVESAHVVIVSVGTQRVGFVVDQLIGQEEVVIKPLGKMLQGTPGMAGATITGDGRIALILDVPSMLKRYAG
jgi:two-component system, chemotaxis family, sensor kinase CheA